MQMSGMSYVDVVKMPVDTMVKYIDWKIKYDQDIEKAKQKALEDLKSQRKSKHR